jgi:uncharacterized protein (TIGR02145 family)
VIQHIAFKMRQNNFSYFFILMVSFFLASCGTSTRDKAFDSIEDSTANSTTTNLKENADAIKIGNQAWAKKNLDIANFKNGDPIPEVKSEDEWEQAGTDGKPAWCYYDNDSSIGKKYGKLYNWYAVNDARGLAPTGWHIATDEEWTTLSNFLGGEDIAGIKLKCDTGWLEKGNGTNITGFAALPGGYRYFAGVFFNAGQDGGWWTSTEKGAGYASLRYLYSANSNVFANRLNCKLGLSVRCVKD